MKKLIQYSICTIFLVFIIYTIKAQTQVIQIDEVKPEIVGDATLSQRLEKDWKKRNSKIQNETVVWYELMDGFYGTYTNDDKNYMALYDHEGNYLQTMIKTQWNNKVPSPLKSSFDLSNYKAQQVTSYWTFIEPEKKCYYLELTDDKGTISRVWANEKGDFSTAIPRVKPSNRQN